MKNIVHFKAGGRDGFTVYRSLLMLAGLVVAIAASYYFVRSRTLAERCEHNLRIIYMALEMYEIERGHLPNLAFFPDHPQEDNDSLLVALERFGVTPESCVCPASPEPHKELGLSYIWNVRLNGKQLQAPGMRTWLLVELNALSDDLPPPHAGYYNVLFTDGDIERVRTPPTELAVY